MAAIYSHPRIFVNTNILPAAKTADGRRSLLFRAHQGSEPAFQPEEETGLAEAGEIFFARAGEIGFEHFFDLGGKTGVIAREGGLEIDRHALLFRQGGERLKLALNRPTKSLKYHYQAFDVPAWERERLPLVCAAQQLLYAAGIGLDCHCLSLLERPRVALRWLSC